MSGAPIQKENPAEAGLPDRIGDAIGTRDCAENPAGVQLPGDPRAATWFKLGYACAVLDRLEARLGIVREVRVC